MSRKGIWEVLLSFCYLSAFSDFFILRHSFPIEEGNSYKSEILLVLSHVCLRK